MYDISIIIPMLNEEQNSRPLYERLSATLAAYGKSYEIVFVDDGSTDKTVEILQSFQKSDSRIVLVQFLRNFGQQAAIIAGIQYSSGRVAVVIDGDLQRPPEAIPILIDKLSEGYDVVYGIRDHRKESWRRRMGSFLLGQLLALMTGDRALTHMSAFTAISEDIVKSLKRHHENEPFYLGLISYLSHGRSASILVQESARLGGATKYNMRRLISLALSFISSSSTLPLRFILVLGGGTAFLTLSGLFIWFILCLSLYGQLRHAGLALILGVLGLLSGLQLVSIGILAEYMRKIYIENRGRPLYIVRRCLKHTSGHGSDEGAIGEQ